MNYDPTKVKVNLSEVMSERNNKDEEELKVYLSNSIKKLEQVNPFIGEGFFSTKEDKK